MIIMSLYIPGRSKPVQGWVDTGDLLILIDLHFEDLILVFQSQESIF